MTEKLKAWLEERWRFDNLKKYRYLFEEWVSKLTPSQIDGFTKQMEQGNIYENAIDL